MDKVLATGRISELDPHTLLLSRTGTARLISDSVAPIKNQNGKILGAVLIFRDITDKQKWLDTIQNNQKLESLGVLAGGIAHDFNNLLMGISGSISLAKMHMESCEAARNSRPMASLENAEKALEGVRLKVPDEVSEE